jgi:REP element-mobilizing transposase RayT
VGKGGFAVATRRSREKRVTTRCRRAIVEGGTFFFTVALADRSSDLLVRHIDRLRRIYKSVQDKYPFESIAVCVLPDHLHAVWLLPCGDATFPLRWTLIRSGFSHGLSANTERSASKSRIGAAMLRRLQAPSENDGRRVGNGEGAVAHPTLRWPATIACRVGKGAE